MTDLSAPRWYANRPGTLAFIVGALLIVGLLTAAVWSAAEQHRANCLRQGFTGCSYMPWNNGQPPATPPMSRQDCLLLRAAGVAC